VAAPADELVRITVGPDGELHVGGPSAGRGAWVGPGLECLQRAEKRLGRALRVKGQLTSASLTADWYDTITALGRQPTAPTWCPGDVRERNPTPSATTNTKQTAHPQSG
jgi:predicted RNA-binding protein YlxR (DUF448 family)